MITRPRNAAPPCLLAVVTAIILAACAAPATQPPATEPQVAVSPAARAAASPSPTARPPQITVVHDSDPRQAARWLRAAWTSSQPVTGVEMAVAPQTDLRCGATVAGDGRSGTFGCEGLLPGAVDHRVRLVFTTAGGRHIHEHAFRTMGDRLTGVKWFTEFEDPTADPLDCASASVRSVHHFTTGDERLTAKEIRLAAQPLNRSVDLGLDPVGIAAIQRHMDPRNAYHYYRFPTREEATRAAVYWLLRSGKPVHVISLAGQHDPLLVGFGGTYGTHLGDPRNDISGVIVQDPQRGDMRPETAHRRPDKYRSAEFQTGRLLSLQEWYGDEWWLAFPYAAVVDGLDMDRNDGIYPKPHWVGTFVIIVDDGDTAWPSDREGRVEIR